MTERGLPLVDGAPACPFVAFEDDRDERAPSPDHRHRCYAEIRPAPRALAHQEAYCLSSAFPVCPTFQDWARREAAKARSGESAVDDEPRRNPPREWSAPPPWTGDSPSEDDREPDRATFAAGGIAGAAAGGAIGAAGAIPGAAGAIPGAAGAIPGAAGAGPGPGPDTDAPEFLADRPPASAGLAGSAADRVAAGEAVGDAWRSGADEPDTPAEPLRRGVEGEAVAGSPADEPWDPRAERAEAFDEFEPEEPRPGPRQSGARPPGRGMLDRRPRVGETRQSRPPVDASGPAWEQPRRYEAYPTLRTRMGLPSVPRVALAALALGIAAIALFSLPTLLGLGRNDDGGGGGGVASPTAQPAGSAATVAPPTQSAATSQIYVVKPGDNLGKIAKRFKTTIEAILKANPQIKDANKIKVGDEITIPSKSTSSGGAASASPAS